MGSAGGGKLHPFSKSTKREEALNPNPSLGTPAAPLMGETVSGRLQPVEVEDGEEAGLGAAEFLSREEVLRRRLRRVKSLSKVYRDHFWALMEEVRSKHRDYYWEFGNSPFEEREEGDDTRGSGTRGGSEDRAGVGNGEWVADGGRKKGKAWERKERSRCGISGCKANAMPLTRYCHSHILSDGKQTLYKACKYPIKSSTHNGQILCGKPVLRAASHSLCPVHYQKYHKSYVQALKKAGFNASTSNRPVPKFHVVIAEFVHQIQTKRRETLHATTENTANDDEKVT